ncbi:5-(carboxyamino)imidazole ribonucleotide mutase [Candidatus Erwinia haradaeae]|uniref:N5-carboxyaminoimidazole ribonucleotide mutase n=1 Tax=Candidatus Erwinia haradaeae TaxID=1922217 RepID=A0A451DM45_9GAMM|nr:5-(carboxyamino)imidazole ribonucleotide mutase [Candidatus Erwinia haradaeae]VFP87837.1 N5-carboxyaminoimidazole ribonucleotide mutase [Candidatus Erwinia haradaeae]
MPYTSNINCIAIVMGSKSDWPTMKHSADILNQFEVSFHCEVISAHRTPEKLFNFAEKAKDDGYQIIIAGAGGAAHLPGMLAAKTLIPVFGVPIYNSMLGGIDSLYSILQMPSGVPVGTLAIGTAGATNAAILAVQVLALNDTRLAVRIARWRQRQTNEVLKHPDPRK